MNRTLIIAEAGVNHNGSIDLAKKLIDVAADAGADVVKFQTFKANKLVSTSAKKAVYQIQNTGSAEESQLKMLETLELTEADHRILIQYCAERNIIFNSTGFDQESLELLNSFGMPFFKIPSGELTNLPYLRQVASFGKPVILSTGMATLGEVEAAIAVLEQGGIGREMLTVLHCTTDYPTDFADVNLKAMKTMETAFQVKIGYSDHTLGIEVPIAAVALGAVCIEKHFTLDRTLPGPDHLASLEPLELKDMVRSIRNIEQAMGSAVKKPNAIELKNREVGRKSIHLAHEISEGHVLQENDLIMKRPGNGISPMMLDAVIGKVARHSLKAEHKLLFSDLL